MKRHIFWSIVFGILFYACGSDSGSGSGSGSGKYLECQAEDAVEYALEEEEFINTEQSSLEDLAGDINPAVLTEDGEYEITSSGVTAGATTTHQWSGEDLHKNNSKAVNSFKNTAEDALSKKKIIKDGEMIILTNDIAIAKQGIDNLIKGLNGYYERENLTKSDYRIEYDLTIRVPANHFDKLVSAVEQGKDEVKSKNIRTRDVTEEYTDLNIRLSSKRDYLKQYTVLLAKATTIKDILIIKENIRTLHEEIERTEGRLRYLSDQVAFSTLTVDLYQQIDYVYKPQRKDSFVERVKSGLNTGWRIVVEVVLFLVQIWSVLLVLGLLFFFVRRGMKKRKKHKND